MSAGCPGQKSLLARLVKRLSGTPSHVQAHPNCHLNKTLSALFPAFLCISSSVKRMQVPKTASVKGVGPQTYADGKLRDSIACRAKSARPIKREAPSVSQRNNRVQSARGPSNRENEIAKRYMLQLGKSREAPRAAWRAPNTRLEDGKPMHVGGSISIAGKDPGAGVPVLGSRLITEELLSSWSQRC